MEIGMSETRLGHVAFCAAAGIVFAAAAWDARTFEGTSRYFPEFAAIAGLIVAIAAGALCIGNLAQRTPAPPIGRNQEAPGRRRTFEKGGPARLWAMLLDTPETEGGRFMAGLAWLGIWAAFIVLVASLGYIVGSALWLCLWFRAVHRWPVGIVVAVAAITILALWAAQAYADVHLPGGNGFLLSLLT
jgi:hypothetical protein